MRTLAHELPDFYLRFAPELERIPWPREVLSTCQACPMIVPHPSLPRFSARARCCTYEPRLPAFLVGRVLERGGWPAELILGRLRADDPLDARSLVVSPARSQAYVDQPPAAFGREESLTCSFWVEGPLGCSIHADRNAICRSWHCRPVGGVRGDHAWDALKKVLRAIEDGLVAICLRDGQPPAPGDDAERWAAWYRWCAAHVQSQTVTSLAVVRTSAFERLLEELWLRVERRDADLPDRIIANVRGWIDLEDGVALEAVNGYDYVELPRWIFVLLSKLDGQTPWYEARAAAEAELERTIPDDLVLMLWRRGLVGPPQDLEGLPVNPDIERMFSGLG